jgi:hypothetical protein
MKSMQHIATDDLILHYYGELPASERQMANEHMAHCAECAAEFQKIQQVLGAVNEETFPVPVREEPYEAAVWERLRPQLPQKSQAWWTAWLAPQRLALAGALAAIIVVAFMAGRVTGPPAGPPQTAGQQPEKVRERVVLVAVGDHLEKSQMILIELANADPQGSGMDISSEQQRARELLSANRLYKQSAQKVADPAIRKVLDDLERVLVEVANSPDKLDSQQLAELQQQIESQGLLFRVRVLGSKVNSKVKEEETAQEPGKAAQRKL